MEDKTKQLSKPSRELSEKAEQFQGTETRQLAEHAAIQVAASARAEVESAFIIALKMPRNLYQSRTEILDSCRNIGFAEKVVYKKPVGKKKVGNQWVQNYVEGPSIRFAEEMIRAWGNIKVQHTTIYEDEFKRISYVNVIDLQKNISYSKQIVVEKIVERKSAAFREVIGERINSQNERIFIVKATDDEIRNKEAAMVSKEIRNASLRMIPQDIIDEAIQIAKGTIEAGVSSDLKSAKKKILDSFAAIGVKPNDLEQYLGHKVDTLSPAEIVDLRAVYKTIDDGQATWKNYVEKEEMLKAGIEKTEIKKDLFKPGNEKTHKSVKEKVG